MSTPLDAGCYRFTCRLLRMTGSPRLQDFIVRSMARAVEARTSALALYVPAERALRVVATYGYPVVLVEHVRIQPGEGVMGSVFASRRPALGRASTSEPRSLRQQRYRGDSYIATPLPGPDGVLGVVSVTDRRAGDPFTRDHLRLLRAYAAPAALAVSRELLRDQSADLAHLATVDPLSGVYNRRFFDQRLEQEIQRRHREGGELALLMIDIDDFKRLNDTRGHLEGDRVLREVADILRRSVRIFDVCARFGGEEFAILMPGANAETAFLVAERIRRHAEAHLASRWPFGESGRPTLSAGVSAASPEMTGEALLAAADAALLWAKSDGKNVVKLHRDLPAHLSGV